MDQYQLEIQSIRRTLNRLKADRSTPPTLVDEYEAEWRNLVALYEAATAAFTRGQTDRLVRDAISQLGFGEWSFDSVYSFVYDAATETDLSGAELAAVVRSTDYAASLVAALEPTDDAASRTVHGRTR